MEFEGFNLLPLEGRMVDPSEQRLVGAILQAARIVERIPRGAEVLVEIGRKVPPGVTPAVAHNEWREGSFPDVETPPSLPRQGADARTPSDLVHVTVSVIGKRTPGMGVPF